MRSFTRVAAIIGCGIFLKCGSSDVASGTILDTNQPDKTDGIETIVVSKDSAPRTIHDAQLDKTDEAGGRGQSSPDIQQAEAKNDVAIEIDISPEEIVNLDTTTDSPWLIPSDGGLIERVSVCYECQVEHCQAEKDACAAVDPDTGASTGPCAEVVECLLGCSDEVCWALCVAKSGPQCAICAKKLRDCEKAACGAVCKIELGQDSADASNNPDTGVAEDPCEALAACCPKLPPLASTVCETTASAGISEACAVSLAAAGGACL